MASRAFRTVARSWPLSADQSAATRSAIRRRSFHIAGQKAEGRRQKCSAGRLTSAFCPLPSDLFKVLDLQNLPALAFLFACPDLRAQDVIVRNLDRLPQRQVLVVRDQRHGGTAVAEEQRAAPRQLTFADEL